MNPRRGIVLKIISVLVFIVMASLIKATAKSVPPGEAVFFRSAFAMPVILGWLAVGHGISAGLRANNRFDHLWRGLVGTTAMGLGFTGLGLLPLPEVTAIGYAAPLLTVIFAAMFLGENVRFFRLFTVALGLVGVLIILGPRVTALSGGRLEDKAALGAMLVLTGAVFSALAQVFVRKLVVSETTSAIVFYFSMWATILSLVTLPFGWTLPPPGDAALLVLAGVLGGIGQVVLTSAYREADASVVAPFEYVSMIFALAIGYGVFGEVPTRVMLLGVALVVAAGILIIWREQHLGLERKKQRQAMSPQG